MPLRLLLVLTALIATSATAAENALGNLLHELTASGKIVGAQAVVGEGDRLVLEKNVGLTRPLGRLAVDSETRFCIGSVSKPLASAVVLSLVADGKLSLDEPVSKWLDGFAHPPTLRHLLSHHGGVYSQRDGLSESQKRWIRDFHLTLDAAVEGILREDQIAAPGERYAYSGAGYCVVGRIAEIAGGKTIDDLLRERLAEPLGMSRTTYFPKLGDRNVATGYSIETPHLLADALHLPLVGGSIYSTARDLARFARMVIGRGELDGVRVLPEALWEEAITPPGFTAQPYALGWSVSADGKRIRHNGALASSRATLQIDLETGRHVAVVYSLGADPGDTQRVVTQAAGDILDAR